MERRVSICGLAAVLSLLVLAGPGFAQERGQGAGAEEVVRLRKLEWQGGEAEVRTPEYRTSVSKGVARPGAWRQFMAAYDTREEWLDELTFEYHVLAMGQVEGKKAYSYYRTRVDYIDIPRGRGHMATVFLRPNTVLRYGMPVAFAVEIYHKGELVAQETEAIAKLTKTWWKDPKVMESELVTTREKLLLNRAQTPFALVDIDAYETIKQ